MKHTLFALLLWSTSALSSWACYAYVPMQIRLLSAELVVVGNIDKVDVKDNRAVGTLRIRKVLMGDPKATVARLSWPSPPAGGPILADGPARFRNGMDGVWILNRNDPLEPYTASYPGDYMTLERGKEIIKDIKAAKAIAWTPARNGLQMAVVHELRDMRNAKTRHKGKQINALAQVTLYPILRNASKETFAVCDFMPDKPLTISATGPDGNIENVNLYEGVRNTMKVNKWAFSSLPPGGTRALGYGYGLPPIQAAGIWHFKIGYRSERDGADFGHQKTWKGELEGAALSIPVAGK